MKAQLHKSGPQMPDRRALIGSQGPKSVESLRLRAIILEAKRNVGGQSRQEVTP